MPEVFIEMELPVATDQSIKRFRVAFSFAGEKREFVADTADILAEQFGEDQILYDKYHEAEFADADLAFNLPDLYKNEADLIVAVFSRDYEQKEWCGLEWRAIFSLIKENQSKRILLSRFDLQDGQGLFGLAGFIDLDKKTPQQFATLILQRLALNEGHAKDHYSVDEIKAKQPFQKNDKSPVNIKKPVPFSGKTKLAFCNRLLTDWPALADYFEISPADQARFRAGDEGRAIWNWLEMRNRLNELPDACSEIDRADLTQLFTYSL